MHKILIADDNKQITSILEEYTKKEGYIPFIAHDGVETLEMFHSINPDILLLDISMPRMDGFEVCREIRSTSAVPIIMITARSEDFEKIMGLDIGADDYIVKPFSPSEIMARIRAIFRRVNLPEQPGQEGSKEQLLVVGSLAVNLDTYTASISEQSVLLTKKEIELLWVLASNQSKVFSRDNLLDSVWGYDYLGDTRTVDSHIKRMRAKLSVCAHPDWEIKTIWGVGYKLEVNDENNT